MMFKAGEFEAKFGMKQPFACIGGNYFGYKQFFSLNIQAVCYYRGYFIEVECGLAAFMVQ